MNILILEDDLETLSVIFRVLFDTKIDFVPVVLSTSDQVEKIINPGDLKFDLILLDRDCASGGSFHVLDIDKFGVDKIIGISSVPQYNHDLAGRGVKYTITKDYGNLDKFATELKDIIETMVKK